MNKILIGVNALLVVAVGYLFYKTSNSGGAAESSKEESEIKKADSVKTEADKKTANFTTVASTPTGKIAFINIDIVNEKSDEVNDLVAEAKRSKANIEAAVESLSIKYQSKMEEYQRTAKAGIAPQSQLEELAKEIQQIEKEAQNKQLQMDNLSMNINEKNIAFQTGLKDFLVKWNNGRYDYILSYSEAIPSMLLGNATLDVTQEVLTQVNADYQAKKGSKSKSKK